MESEDLRKMDHRSRGKKRTLTERMATERIETRMRSLTHPYRTPAKAAKSLVPRPRFPNHCTPSKLIRQSGNDNSSPLQRPEVKMLPELSRLSLGRGRGGCAQANCDMGRVCGAGVLEPCTRPLSRVHTLTWRVKGSPKSVGTRGVKTHTPMEHEG